MKVRATLNKCKNCIFNKDGYCRISTDVTVKDVIKGNKYKQCKYNR